MVNSGIAELEKKGFLIVKPRSGTFVADYRRKGTVETLVAIMKYNGGRIRREEIRSILEVRIALDTLIARLSIPMITDEEIQVLLEKVEAIQNTASVQEAIEAAFAFQHEFALSSKNTLIPLIFQSFHAPIFTMWERFCELYGVEMLYNRNYTMWTYIKNRNTQGAVDWIEYSLKQCIDGDTQIYFD